MNYNAIELFGLTESQKNILLSLECNLVKLDIDNVDKGKWSKRWKALLCSTSSTKISDTEKSYVCMSEDELYSAVLKENQLTKGNKTWFYLIMLEAALFVPYFPLGESEEQDKKYKKLKYKPKNDFLMSFAKKTKIMPPEYIERFQETYKKSYGNISGKKSKILINILITIAASFLVAATAGVFAGPIAVTLLGGQFAGLHGAALISACLAALGGGAIAAGGFGMAGGVAVIVGGGALLGAAAGGGAAAGINALVKNSPDFTLSQAAKLEVVMKEILLNLQKDTINAQKVIENLAEQIKQLKSENKNLQKNDQENKKEIENLKKSLEILEKAYNDMIKFKSSFDIGLSAEG